MGYLPPDRHQALRVEQPKQHTVDMLALREQRAVRRRPQQDVVLARKQARHAPETPAPAELSLTVRHQDPRPDDGAVGPAAFDGFDHLIRRQLPLQPGDH